MKKYIAVSHQAVVKNSLLDERLDRASPLGKMFARHWQPPIIVMVAPRTPAGAQTLRAHQVEILGPSMIVAADADQRRAFPGGLGPRVWIETEAPLVIDGQPLVEPETE